jgi:hypothetical protein
LDRSPSAGCVNQPTLKSLTSANARRNPESPSGGTSQGDSYVLGRHFVFDEGSPTFCDLWEFSPVNDEECLGEGVDLAVFESAERLLDAAVTNYGASIDRWVNQEIIQDEYQDLNGAHPQLPDT